MTITVTVEGVDKVSKSLDALEGDVTRAIDRTVVDLEGQVLTAVGRHARPGGQLGRSVFKQRIVGGWELGNDSQVAPYARWVHDGAHAHVILPKEPRKALRWPVPGGFKFAKRVDHPGYKGDPWLHRAAAVALPTFERHLEAILASRK